MKLVLLHNWYNDKWGFAGLVPAPLGYCMKDGSACTAEQVESDMRLPGNYRKTRLRYWDTREEAVKAANEAGYEVREEN